MRQLSAFMMLGLACILWGSSFVMTKEAMLYMPAIDVIFWRSALAALWFLPWVIRGDRRAISRTGWSFFVLIGFLTIPVTYVLQFVALHYISAASAAILIGVEPLLIALMSFVVLGNRVGKSVWLSGVLAFAGVYCVFADQVSWHQDFRGYAMVLLSTIVVAFWVVLTKKALATYSPRFSTACVAVFGFLTFLPIIPWLSASPLSFPWAAWGWILLLALTSSVLGQLFWNMGLKRVESSKAGIFLVLEPIAGVLLAYFYLQEPAGVYLWLGLLLVALSIVVVTYPRKTKLN